jgi:hypothetical protein
MAEGSINDRFEFVRRKKFQRPYFPSRALTWGRFFDICIQGRKIQLLELSLKREFQLSHFRDPAIAGPEQIDQATKSA